MNSTIIARCSMIPLALGLAACGGGGGSIGTTPTPPPAPTPPPPPPPPASTANADLANLTLSETFTNDAATGTVNYPKTGDSGTSTAAASSVSVVFDATSRTYTITNGARSQSFATANIDTTASTSQLTVYKRVTGNTTDTLTLTRPGQAGRLTFRYVGGGFWQQTIDGATAVTGSLDAFAYGVETLDSQVVRTGGASYDVDLLGIVARPQTVFNLAGQGVLIVNFFSGAITGSSFANGLRETQADNGAPGRSGAWRFTGTLASNRNAVNGTLSLYSSSTDQLDGTAVGRFYGPASEEVGLAFQAGGADGTRSVGTIIGRRGSGTIAGSNPSLTNLQFDETFLGTSVDRFFRTNPTTGVQIGDDTLRQSGQLQLAYRAGTQSFALQSAGTDLNVFGASNLIAAESNARYSVYEQRNGSTVSRLALFRSGSGNDEFALTYSSFAQWQRTEPGPIAGDNFSRSGYLTFGIVTPNSAIPRTGLATYNGIVRGEGTPGAGSTLPLLSIEGTARLDFDFARAVFGGSMNLIAVNPSNSARTDLGAFPFSDGLLTSQAFNTNQGFFFGTINGNNNNRLSGYLYGPNAEELAATFSTTFITPGTTSFGGFAQGAIVARRAP